MRDKQPPPGQTPGGTPAPVKPEGNQRLVGWIVAGSGAGIAVLGGVFGLLASQTHADFEDSNDAVERRDLRSTGESQALIADIGMGVGAAALITGLVLVFTADDAPAAATGTTGLHIGPSSDGFGLSIGGSF